MKLKLSGYTVVLCSLMAIACSNESEEPSKDHVFKGYENAYKKAEQLQPQLDEAEEKRRKQIEDSMR